MPAVEPDVAADESEPLRSPESGDRVAKRSGAWNAQDDKFVQSCVLAARLGGGSRVTIRYGGVEAEIEVKHTKAAEPELVKQTRGLRLDAVAVQQQRVAELQQKVEAQKAAKKAKKARQKENKKRAAQPTADEGEARAEPDDADAATHDASGPAPMQQEGQPDPQSLVAQQAARLVQQMDRSPPPPVARAGGGMWAPPGPHDAPFAQLAGPAAGGGRAFAFGAAATPAAPAFGAAESSGHGDGGGQAALRPAASE